MSLKKALQDRVNMYKGEIMPYSEMEHLCKLMGRRVSNGERRLRDSESPEIETVYNGKGRIVGYRKRKEQLSLF